MASDREKDQTFTSHDEPLNQTDEVCNNFANDGSFFELFQKKMDQQKSETVGQRKVDVTAEKRDEPCTSQSHDSSTGDIYKQKNRPYQAIVGKRKAMMKSIELREKRKRRREEIEEQQSTDDVANKSSAWKSYMAEVKSYEAQNCSDDRLKRPLVK